MKQKAALVLSGGGARGIAHIGVIEALEKRNFEISSISGTSMGALVGAVYALGKLPAFKEWICSLDKLKIFQLIDFSFSTQGLIKGDRVLGVIKELVGDGNIEDLKIPYAANASDVIKGKEVVFTSGNIFEAIRASIAIPSVLTPVKSKKGLLVDGGVFNNVPISNVQRNPGDILVAVDVSANVPVIELGESAHETQNKQRAYLNKIKEFQLHLHRSQPMAKEDKMGYFNIIDNTIHLMINQMSQMAMEKQAPDILINVSRETCSIFDFYRAEELIKTGRKAAQIALEKYLVKP